MARWLTAAFWREHLLLASYGIWGLFLFLVFLISSFPYRDALSGALSPAGLTLSYEDQHFHFPIGAEMENVRLVRLGNPMCRCYRAHCCGLRHRSELFC